MVVVENPPTMDDEGNMVRSRAQQDALEAHPHPPASSTLPGVEHGGGRAGCGAGAEVALGAAAAAATPLRLPGTTMRRFRPVDGATILDARRILWSARSPRSGTCQCCVACILVSTHTHASCCTPSRLEVPHSVAPSSERGLTDRAGIDSSLDGTFCTQPWQSRRWHCLRARGAGCGWQWKGADRRQATRPWPQGALGLQGAEPLQQHHTRCLIFVPRLRYNPAPHG